MKKTVIWLRRLTLLAGFSSFIFCGKAQDITWKTITESSTKKTEFNLLQSSETENVVEFKLNAYGLKSLVTPKGEASNVIIKEGAWIQKLGAPDLPKLSQALMIPGQDEMKIEVVASDFIEVENIDIAPSKGIMTRDKSPDEYPFVYGEEYNQDAFFPSAMAELSDSYIIRDVRGLNIMVYPLQYNPVKKTLRIYKSITVKVTSTGKKGTNVLEQKALKSVDQTFDNIYSNHFINYNRKGLKLSENGGKMLIICYSSFMSAMQPFVNWKNSIGIQTQLVDYATIGSSSALDSYVTNYYNQNGLTFLLLVGDAAYVPSSYTSAGDSDNNYGYIVGSDHYLDIFVGRFSAESSSQVTNMVNRTIYYERDMSSSASGIYRGVGIASNECCGDNNESDEQHMDYIASSLQGYGYSINSVYQNGGSASTLSYYINQGTGIINYVGHGTQTAWTSMYYGSSDVSSLSNTSMFPFVVSVACLVGDFVYYTCFAESWLRASYGGQPSGAIAFCGSTINQSWSSPMRAQDAMNDLLVANSYKTYGGVFVNGLFSMIQGYGVDGENMADTWTIFGDPSVQTRTPGHPNGPSSNPTDTQAPTAPTGLTSSNVTSSSVTLSWNASTDNVGVTGYDIYRGSTNIGTTGSTTYNATGLSANTSYTFSVRAKDAAGNISSPSNSISVTTIDGGGGSYCVSQGSSSTYEWIAGVQIGSFSNTSGAAGYTDFTSQTANLSIGANNVTLTPGFSSSAYTEYWSIWIDFNGNGSFTDTGEQVFSGNGTSTVSGSMNIPAGSSGTTRMRITMKYNAAPTSCETFSYGEVEDYTVSFTGGGDDTQAPSVPAGLTSTGTTETTVSLSWNASSDNVAVTGYDVYNGSSVAGSTSSTSYTVSGLTANTSYTFYVRAKDAAGNVSGYSNAATATTQSGGGVTYCASQGNDFTYEWIAGVQVGSFSNSSGAAGYTDFTNQTVTMNLGANSVTLTPGFSSSAYAEYWSIWIDFNNNGSFTDAGEQVFTGNGSSTVSGSITIPSGSPGTTRMRVSMKYNAAPTSCETFTYGEVEDYTVNLNRGDNSRSGNSINEDMIIYPNPNDGKFRLQLGTQFEGKVMFKIIGIDGKIVYSEQINIANPIQEIPFNFDLNPGIYQLQVIMGHKVATQPFVVK